MGCDRPSGFTRGLAELEFGEFPPNWEGELPPRKPREELERDLSPGFEGRDLKHEQVEEVLGFFDQYEERYYEAPNGGGTFHRECGGGAMKQIEELGVYCANCGKLPDLLPPECMR